MFVQMAVKKKVVLLGDAAVGKTSLVRRFVDDAYDDSYIATIGTKVSKRVMEVPLEIGTETLNMVIWDVFGQHGYTGVQRGAMQNSHAAILVCDGTNPKSVQNLVSYWLPLIYEWSWNIPIYVVANKADLDAFDINEQMLRQVAWMHRQSYPEGPFSKTIGDNHGITSAKTGAGVEDMFMALGKLLLAAPDRSDYITDSIEAAWDRLQALKGELTFPKATTDWLIMDFLGGPDYPDELMRELRVEMVRAGLDISDPQQEPLEILVPYLADRELPRLPATEVEERINRRLEAIAMAFSE